MAHTVELLPDDELAGEVRRLWQRLADAGLPSLAAHPHPTNRPHLTLTLVDVLPPAGRDALDAAFDDVLPMPARLEALAAFPGREAVLYWAVVPSVQLLALHARVTEGLVAAGTAQRPLHAPGRWTAHCTLAHRLTPPQLGAAVEVLRGWTAAEGTWAAARTYDTVSRTAEPLGRASLGPGR